MRGWIYRADLKQDPVGATLACRMGCRLMRTYLLYTKHFTGITSFKPRDHFSKQMQLSPLRK